MIRPAWALLLSGALALGGCGKELTAGGLREGEVSAVATDEPGSSAARFTLGREGGIGQASVSTLAGVVDLTVAVSLIAESGAVVPITNGSAAARVAIGTSARVPLGTQTVPVGVYPAVRLTFTEVVAEVQGLPLAGTLFTGSVAVDLAAGPLVADVTVPVTVHEGDRSTVVLRLNSGAWLSLAQLVPSIPPAARVTALAFREAIAVAAE